VQAIISEQGNGSMKTLSTLALLGLLPLVANAAEPWQEVTVPSVAEAAATFPKPPKEYGAIHWAIWGGPQTKERVMADIDRIAANGGGVYMINNSQRVAPKYLSPEYMDIVKAAVQECKKNGMKVWIETDCGYPDGFAGGLISQEYPMLGMQGIITDCHTTVAAGATLDMPLPPDTLGIMANPVAGAAAPAADAPAGTPMPVPADGIFKYQPPRRGAGQIIVQLPTAELHFSVTPGEPFTMPVPAGTKVFLGGGGGGARGGRGGGGGATVIPIPTDGHLKWTAPAGSGAFDVSFVRRVYRSSPTRNDNGEDGGATKDGYYSLIDYLDPVATNTFIKLIYETYEKAVGDEFGKTVLGFRGDETDFSVMPFTPKLLETFQKVKGYDLKPYIVQFVGGGAGAETQRVRADYADVWSGMFRDNFYKVQQDWCRARGMDYMSHLNREETMTSLVRTEGSFWRDMRYVGVPGIDNLNQIGPGIVADFPKLAGSAAHLYGRSLVWEEEGGGTGQGGKFVFDYQLVRGVNYMNIRGLTNAPAGSGALQDPAAAIGNYVSRSQHLMAVGRPAAQVALYHPTDSMWLGDREADTVTVKLVTQLMEHQIDFDHIDADTLATVCTLEKEGLKNLSGQVYKAVVVPTSTVIQKNVLERLRAFAAGGGKVVFVGRTPTQIIDKTFLHPEPGTPDLSFATLEPTPDITEKVVAALPKPDVKLDSACPPVKYMHRSLKDGDVYFFYNESDQSQTRTATVVGSGQVQVWDAASGTIHPLAGVAKAEGSVAVPLALAPYEGRFIVIGPLPTVAAQAWPTLVGNQTLVALDGNWSVALGGAPTDTQLKPWQDLGAASFSGTAEYRKTFTAPASLPQGQRVYLDLGNVREVAHVRLNGTDFAAQGWPPYVWDVTGAVKSGDNTLEVQVQIPAEGGRGGGGGGGGGAARGARGGPAAGAPGATTNPSPTGAPTDAPTDAPGAAGAARGAGGRGAGRGRGAGAGPGAGPAPAGAPGNAAPAAPAARGLLGPVRLITQ